MIKAKILILESLPHQIEAILSGTESMLTALSLPHLADLMGMVDQYAPELIVMAYPFETVSDLLSLLKLIRAQDPLLPVVLVVDSITETHYLEALNHGANGFVFRDNLLHLPAIIERVLQQASEQKRLEQIFEARLFLSTYSITASLDELLQKTLDEAEKLTHSQIGFFHFMDNDQESLWLQTWSTNTLQNMCTAEGKGSHYPVNQAGVWVDCVRQREPVIHNDYANLPHRQGLPKGHAPIIRELVIPVIQNNQIFAILGVGNKAEDYTEQDIEVVSQLAYMTWDVVKRKRAEQALSESEQRLQQIHLLKKFIQNTAHEFRTPLTAIITSAYLMTHTQQPEVRQAKEEQIQVQVQRMTRLVDTLLMMTELESNSTLTLKAINVGTLLHTLCRTLHFTRGNPLLCYEPLPSLPLVMGDENYLVKALEEILDNAYRFTPKNGLITVQAGIEATSNIWIDICDTGMGIPAAIQPFIFELFWRQDEAHTTPGLGLGLPIARKIIELHGGQITVNSQEEQGSTFRILLPIASQSSLNR